MAVVLPEPRHLVGGQLEAREAIVVADAKLAEAERTHDLLGGVDLSQLGRGDAISVLEARRQTRERRLVPRRQPEPARELADLRLPQLGLDERRAHATLRRGAHPGAVVAEVVHDRAVHEHARAFALGDWRQPHEQLFLAEEAAVSRVLRVLGIIELARLHDLVAHAEQPGEALGLGQLARGIRLGIRGHEERAVADGLARRASQERRIDAARERDDHAFHLAEDVHQTLVLRVDRPIHAHASSGPASLASGVVGF